MSSPHVSPIGDGELLPVFVYGTLQPGEVRGFAMQGRVVDAQGVTDHVRGRLWDTGFQYPALTLDGDNRVPGLVMHLLAETADETWQLLVDIEGGVDSTYVPTIVETESGTTAVVFAYCAEPPSYFAPIAAWRGGPIAFD